MPLGDSITDITCYAPVLSKLLKAGGHTNFEFIGTRTSNQSCGADAPNVKNEGHSGYGVTYLPSNSTRPACTKSTGCGSYAELQTWAAEKPDIVLLHYGTNDVWDGQTPANILAAYLAVIAEFRKQNANVIFFVSKIIKLNPDGCGTCLSSVGALAAALTDSWASTNSTATSPIHLVDDYNSGFDPDNSADTGDGVHPTLAGATKMATATSQAVIARAYF
jgi:lysophospholipase L1-like esterase